MKFDFNSLNLEPLDANTNATPDIFFNQNCLSFSRRVVEELGYPAHVLCMLDAKNRVFAIRACRKDESRAFKFSKPKEEQKATIALSGKNCLIRCANVRRRSGKRAFVISKLHKDEQDANRALLFYIHSSLQRTEEWAIRSRVSTNGSAQPLSKAITEMPTAICNFC